MLINEGGLIRAIKRAYKAGGYTVLNTGNDVAIYTDHWFAMANRALLPRKVLATIVEHMGMIPERDRRKTANGANAKGKRSETVGMGNSKEPD